MQALTYSLFFSPRTYAAKYIYGLVEVIRTRDLYFPEWTLIIYYDYTIYNNHHHPLILRLLRETKQLIARCVTGVESYPVYVRSGYRFLALQDDAIQVVLFRDLDSPLTKRDRQLVDKWLDMNVNSNSDKSLLYPVLCYSWLEFSQQELKHGKQLNPYLSIYDGPGKDPKCVRNPNVLYYPAGGTGIVVPMLKQVLYGRPKPQALSGSTIIPSYIDFIKQEYKVFQAEYGILSHMRGFEEVYLRRLLNRPQVLAIQHDMFFIRSGLLEGRYYDADDFKDEPRLFQRLRTQCSPMLDYVFKRITDKMLARHLEQSVEGNKPGNSKPDSAVAKRAQSQESTEGKNNKRYKSSV